MTRFEHIIEALVSLAAARIQAAIATAAGEHSDLWEEPLVWDAIGHAEAVAAIDAAADVPPARRPFPHEPWLDQPYSDYYDVAIEQQYWQQVYPDNPDGHTLYCPRGCNQLWTTAGYDECGACGSIMRPGADVEGSYYDSLVVAGHCR
jgi:hypothetical protein